MWLIGQAPSSDGSDNFSGRSGVTLSRWANVPFDLFHSVFKCVNLLDEYPGRAGKKGDKFPMQKAEEAALKLAPTIPPRTRVVCVGKKVAEAFGIDTKSRQPFIWFPHGDAEFSWMPHPSGVNLFYNNPNNVFTAKVFLARAARERV